MNIKEMCGILKLSYIGNNYEEEIIEAKQTNLEFEDFLTKILRQEMIQRKENGILKYSHSFCTIR